jgi:hypothetical protein
MSDKVRVATDLAIRTLDRRLAGEHEWSTENIAGRIGGEWELTAKERSTLYGLLRDREARWYSLWGRE